MRAAFLDLQSNKSEALSVRRIGAGAAAMGAQELVVDGLAAAKSFFGAVPETDAVLAELPAQAHFAALIEAQKIDQADVQVLDQRAGSVRLDRALP